ncbi:MAG: HupE/UreJ family protein, partial [Sphingorhabdus sp.]|nr:HupE/UreJ family protein [Sphingorhabdus sp.]
MIRWLLCLIFLGLGVPAAQADELRPGYLEFTQSDAQKWVLVWKAPTKGGLTARTQPVLPADCAVVGNPIRTAFSGTVTSRFNISCKGDIAGKTVGLSNMDTAQTDILTRIAPLDRPVQAARITASNPMVTIAKDQQSAQIAWSYFVIGIEHILLGFDHLLFVIALVLLIGGGWATVKAVTAFTIAHSLTLAATIFGFVGLPQRPVEAVIALSILFLAVEIIKRDPAAPRYSTSITSRAPWIVAFLFGLLHGFGFAGALQEIGLPQNDIPAALITFNLGVETGQVA